MRGKGVASASQPTISALAPDLFQSQAQVLHGVMGGRVATVRSGGLRRHLICTLTSALCKLQSVRHPARAPPIAQSDPLLLPL